MKIRHHHAPFSRMSGQPDTGRAGNSPAGPDGCPRSTPAIPSGPACDARATRPQPGPGRAFPCARIPREIGHFSARFVTTSARHPTPCPALPCDVSVDHQREGTERTRPRPAKPHRNGQPNASVDYHRAYSENRTLPARMWPEVRRPRGWGSVPRHAAVPPCARGHRRPRCPFPSARPGPANARCPPRRRPLPIAPW
jgi:hypothetical protein